MSKLVEELNKGTENIKKEAYQKGFKAGKLIGELIQLRRFADIIQPIVDQQEEINQLVIEGRKEMGLPPNLHEEI